MKLGKFIESAKNSELNTLAVRDDVSAIVGFINEGLTELHTLFTINTNEYVLMLEGGKSIYTMPDDFLFLTGAYELENGKVVDVPINEEFNVYSINTISYNQIQVPLTQDGAVINIIYAAKPEYLNEADVDKEIPVPEQMIQALFAFVAYKAHGAIRLDRENSTADAYFARFKSACKTLEMRGTGVAADDLEMPCRISSRGFA